jgi:peptide/nickel transport system permease protein
MSEGRIVRRHALKNSLIPIITVGGDELASFLNGAVVIETIFAWPGIGGLFIQAIERRDLPLVLACVFVIATMVIVVNLVIDLAYAWIDPRASLLVDSRRRGRGRGPVTPSTMSGPLISGGQSIAGEDVGPTPEALTPTRT